jgi:hypothetical protein
MSKSVRKGIAMALGAGIAAAIGIHAAMAQTPAIKVGEARGAPGDTVKIKVTLVKGGGKAVAASSDILYDGTQLSVKRKPNGKPDCTINPAIGPEGAASKSLLASEPNAPESAKLLRLGVIGIDNSNPIPDGLLLTCSFVIAPGATPGAKVLKNTPSASYASAQPLAVKATNGKIIVRRARERRHK